MASCHAGVRGSRAPDDGDLSRPAQVFVPEADYDRARNGLGGGSKQAVLGLFLLKAIA